MQTETRAPVPSAIPRQLLTIFGFMVNWFGYGFLAFPVLIVFSMLLFDYLVLFGGQLPFLEYLSWLPGLSADSDLQVNGDQILWGFSLLSTAFWGLSKLRQALVKAVRRRLGRPIPSEAVQTAHPTLASMVRPYLRKLWIACLLITAVFLVAFITLPSARLAHPGDLVPLYLIFSVLYLITVGSVASHVLFDGSSRLILEWAQRLSAQAAEGPAGGSGRGG
jgi:hypothetical protein